MIKIILVICLNFTFLQSFSQSTKKTMKRLPDTGQNMSYTTTFGEDNDYNINPQFFIDHGNGTLTDTITGLVWQQTDGGDMTFGNAATYCDTLTLGGYNNWRLPNAREAFSILNHQNYNPALNPTLFKNASAEYWWTCDSPFSNTTQIWCITSEGGLIIKKRTESLGAGGKDKIHVRAVRDAKTPEILKNRFITNSNNTITDKLTGLIWEQIPNPNSNYWEQALLYAENLITGGFTDWRLPNIKELQSLNSDNTSNSSIDREIFKSINTNKYWSSTSLSYQSSKAWYMSTSLGTTSHDDKTNTNYFICVRDGQTMSAIKKIIIKNIEVFPNPFTSTINLKGNNENERFEILNHIGQIIFSGKEIETQDFSLLPNGVYVLKIIDKTTSILKLIKN